MKHCSSQNQKNKRGQQATVKEHLEAVTTLAEKYGAEIGTPQSAGLATQLHDFGNYSGKFQDVLKGKPMVPTDHAICGATFLSKAVNQRNELS